MGEETIRINGAKISLMDKKNGKQINGIFNNTASADENK
jgi:hypothetical protein